MFLFNAVCVLRLCERDVYLLAYTLVSSVDTCLSSRLEVICLQTHFIICGYMFEFCILAKLLNNSLSPSVGSAPEGSDCHSASRSTAEALRRLGDRDGGDQAHDGHYDHELKRCRRAVAEE